jgi:antitoxin (DNA-binding transcriptional repressor) of toxin-antitoxin stability system
MNRLIRAVFSHLFARQNVHSECTFKGVAMQTYSAKQARLHFSKLLKMAEHGEEIIINRRGKDIACLGKVQRGRKGLPGMKEFRKTIDGTGLPLGEVLSKMRDEWR